MAANSNGCPLFQLVRKRVMCSRFQIRQRCYGGGRKGEGGTGSGNFRVEHGVYKWSASALFLVAKNRGCLQWRPRGL